MDINFYWKAIATKIPGKWENSMRSCYKPGKILFNPCSIRYATYTAISRKVVGKSALDNPKRYCG